MKWNEGGYGLVPFNGSAPGSWGAGGFGEYSFGGIPESGWGSAGFGELAFDATPTTPVEPEKPKVPDSIKWAIGGMVTPVKKFPQKSRIRVRNEALLLAAIL
jgi:hypothetical protein